jgi:phospholipid/cholesterol/gamma-HCH transport system substrate-binding protein
MNLNGTAMETKANYTLIGLFTLAVIAGVFGFIYWFQGVGGGARAYYRVVFDGSGAGLSRGGPVLFHGIRVGEVTGLALDPKHPERVVASIAVDKSVPLHKDTDVGMQYQGLTGIAALSLKGGSADSPVLSGTKDNPAELVAPSFATQDVTQTAREVLSKLDKLLSDNQKALHTALANINTFTAALANNAKHIDNTLANVDKFSDTLARNSDRIDKIVQGMQDLTGGEDGKSGQINEAARSIHGLAKKLDERTAAVTKGLSSLATTGKKQLDALSAEARRTLGTLDRTIKNIDKNPSRLIWGGSSTPAGGH